MVYGGALSATWALLTLVTPTLPFTPHTTLRKAAAYLRQEVSKGYYSHISYYLGSRYRKVYSYKNEVGEAKPGEGEAACCQACYALGAEL